MEQTVTRLFGQCGGFKSRRLDPITNSKANFKQIQKWDQTNQLRPRRAGTEKTCVRTDEWKTGKSRRLVWNNKLLPCMNSPNKDASCKNKRTTFVAKRAADLAESRM